MQLQSEKQMIYALIDDLKAICSNYGLGNSGNEYKIITETFLYKFLNDKFLAGIKELPDFQGKSTKEIEQHVQFPGMDLVIWQFIKSWAIQSSCGI